MMIFKSKWVFPILLLIMSLVYFRGVLYIGYVKLFAHKQSVEMIDERLYRYNNDGIEYKAEFWVLERLSLIKIHGFDPDRVVYIKLFNNKTGEFYGESNICEFGYSATLWPSKNARKFSYGNCVIDF